MKKIAKRVTVGLLVLMLALTALSRTIYYVITPQITVAQPASRSLTKDFMLEIALDYPAARIEYMHLTPPAPLFIDVVHAIPGHSHAAGDVFATVNLTYFHAAADAYRKAVADAEADLEVFDISRQEQHSQAQKATAAQRKTLADTLQNARDTLSQLQNGTADRAFAREVAQMEQKIADMEDALALDRLLYENGAVAPASLEAQQKAIDNERDDLAFKLSQNADAQSKSLADAQRTVSDLSRQLAELGAEASAPLSAAEAQSRRKLVEACDNAVAAYQTFTSLIDEEGNLRFTRDCTVAAVHVKKGGSLDGRMMLYEYVEDYTPTMRADVPKDLFNALAVFTRFECKIGNEMVTLTISGKDNADGNFALLLTPAAALSERTLEVLRASGSVAAPVSIETQYYETVVPRAAVQGIDENGQKGTIYVVTTRASYFGDEQCVEAYEVRILDANGAYAAIEPVQRLPMGSVVAVKRNATLADGIAVVIREQIN